MQTSQSVQQGIITAIYILEANGRFPAILNELRARVVPAYLKLALAHSPKKLFSSIPEKAAVTSHRGPVRDSLEFLNYRAGIQNRNRLRELHNQKYERQKQLYDRELRRWIDTFRLTADGTSTGAPLEWVLEFAADECRNGVNEPPSNSLTDTDESVHARTPPQVDLIHGPPSPEHFSISGTLLAPRTNEPFKDFWLRIEPGLQNTARRLWNRGRQKSSRSKRNYTHYEWFVLRRFASWNYRKIATAYADEVSSAEESNIAKAVKVIEKQLGLAHTGN